MGEHLANGQPADEFIIGGTLFGRLCAGLIAIRVVMSEIP